MEEAEDCEKFEIGKFLNSRKIRRSSLSAVAGGLTKFLSAVAEGFVKSLSAVAEGFTIFPSAVADELVKSSV